MDKPRGPRPRFSQGQAVLYVWDLAKRTDIETDQTGKIHSEPARAW